MSLMKHILNESINEGEFNRKYKFIKDLRDYFEDGNIYDSWFKWILISLQMERKFTDEVHLAGKHILKHIDIKPINTEEEAMKYFTETYDVYHPLRNNVETLSSVEVIRIYYKENAPIDSNIKL